MTSRTEEDDMFAHFVFTIYILNNFSSNDLYVHVVTKPVLGSRDGAHNT